MLLNSTQKSINLRRLFEEARKPTKGKISFKRFIYFCVFLPRLFFFDGSLEPAESVETASSSLSSAKKRDETVTSTIRNGKCVAALLLKRSQGNWLTIRISFLYIFLIFFSDSTQIHIFSWCRLCLFITFCGSSTAGWARYTCSIVINISLKLIHLTNDDA